MTSTLFLAAGGTLLLFGVGAFLLAVRRAGRGLPLAGTCLCAAGLLLVVSGWLMLDGGVNRGEAVKTGGLAAGAVVALYALWLNDRRRRVEEERQELERRKADHDRERVDDERFARSIELLGHEADQVRVGAMHALAGLARASTAYTQTVLDVLCAYLRRPFEHPAFEHRADDPDRAKVDASVEQNRERQVRLTAQRLIGELLPLAGREDKPGYDLDLTEAVLEYLDLRGRLVGDLLLRRARLHGLTRLARMEVRERGMFTWAEFTGRVDMECARFDGGLSLHAARFSGPTGLRQVTVGGFLAMKDVVADAIDLEGMTVPDAPTIRLPPGWRTESESDGRVRLVRQAG